MTLETDRSWIKEHTRLGDRAREWIKSGRKSDRLLRGAALSSASAWRERQPAKAPSPSQATLHLIAASERGAKLRQGGWIVAALLVAVMTATLAIVAFLQRGIAIKNENIAVEQREIALENERQALEERKIAIAERERAEKELRQSQINQSRFLAHAAREQISSADPILGLLLSLEALPDSSTEKTRPYVEVAERSLFSSLLYSREEKVLFGHTDGITALAISQNGSFIASGSNDATIRIWNANTVEIGHILRGHEGRITGLTFNQDDSLILSASDKGVIKCWDLASG